jgi:hypothetical protein
VAFPNDRLMGEEDASSLRDDPTLRAQAAAFANRLLAAYQLERGRSTAQPLSEAAFVAAVDAGVEAPRPGANGQVQARCHSVVANRCTSRAGEDFTHQRKDCTAARSALPRNRPRALSALFLHLIFFLGGGGVITF